MHYRLADIADPLASTVKEAVTHALSHLHTVQQDAQRLERKTGCCVPDSAQARPAFSCCDVGKSDE
jgi:hypothetical protein